jgi:hypothetical protein
MEHTKGGKNLKAMKFEASNDFAPSNNFANLVKYLKLILKEEILELLEIKDGQLEHIIEHSLSESTKTLTFSEKQKLFDDLFNDALAKLEETFSEKHYEAYFDKIANHFDDVWKEQLKEGLWKGSTEHGGITNIDLHFIPGQGMYMISVEEVAQCQTLDKAFLFDMNKAIQELQSRQESNDEVLLEGGEKENNDDRLNRKPQNDNKQEDRKDPKGENEKKKIDKESKKSSIEGGKKPKEEEKKAAKNDQKKILNDSEEEDKSDKQKSQKTQLKEPNPYSKTIPKVQKPLTDPQSTTQNLKTTSKPQSSNKPLPSSPKSFPKRPNSHSKPQISPSKQSKSLPITLKYIQKMNKILETSLVKLFLLKSILLKLIKSAKSHHLFSSNLLISLIYNFRPKERRCDFDIRARKPLHKP